MSNVFFDDIKEKYLMSKKVFELLAVKIAISLLQGYRLAELHEVSSSTVTWPVPRCKIASISETLFT